MDDTIIAEQVKLIKVPYSIADNIGNSFDDKETVFVEKVNNRYDQDIKLQSFEEKLVICRLHYAITA
ncbi:unnamed protein product [Didymodactylos carnosus]|uniref:Uncharacterized protein n=1 Tax=Didymodactylos carnosus TaxID=1234261 RepID=A0A815AKT7_9BILA|nr:unnamed protein product [Didymodactylos carnosus]CAF4033522.1 unnamed protein product [Didymodactylos carnosus]